MEENLYEQITLNDARLFVFLAQTSRLTLIFPSVSIAYTVKSIFSNSVVMMHFHRERLQFILV